MARSIEERLIDVPHEHSAHLQSFPQLATEMAHVPESEITSPTPARAVESAPIEAERGELVGWKEDSLLEIAGPPLPGIVAIAREHIGSDDRESTSVSVYQRFLGFWISSFVLRSETSSLRLPNPTLKGSEIF